MCAFAQGSRRGWRPAPSDVPAVDQRVEEQLLRVFGHAYRSRRNLTGPRHGVGLGQYGFYVVGGTFVGPSRVIANQVVLKLIADLCYRSAIEQRDHPDVFVNDVVYDVLHVPVGARRVVYPC